jgi:hypothetical protein
MPDPNDRHGRDGKRASFGGWGRQPPRSAQRAAAADPPEVKGRAAKDRWEKCKANNGGPHVLILRQRVDVLTGEPAACGWGFAAYRDYEIVYRCGHDEACQFCGKVSKRRLTAEDCPGYAPVTPRETARIARETAAHVTRTEEWRLKWYKNRGPKPAPGVSGYRRKR